MSPFASIWNVRKMSLGHTSTASIITLFISLHSHHASQKNPWGTKDNTESKPWEQSPMKATNYKLYWGDFLEKDHRSYALVMARSFASRFRESDLWELSDFFQVSCSRWLQKPQGLQCTNNGRKAASNNTPRQWSCHSGSNAKYGQGFKWNGWYLYTLEGSRVPNLAAWVFILLVAPPLEQWG